MAETTTNAADQCRQHTGVVERLDNHQSEIRDLWKAVDKIRERLDRLPVWATCLIAALCGVIGWMTRFI